MWTARANRPSVRSFHTFAQQSIHGTRRSSCQSLSDNFHGTILVNRNPFISTATTSRPISCWRVEGANNVSSSRNNCYDDLPCRTRSTLQVPLRRHMSFFSNNSSSKKIMPWHYPEFLRDAPVGEAEAWLEHLLRTENDVGDNTTSPSPVGEGGETDEEGGKLHTPVSSSIVDAEAFLVIFKSLARASKSQSGTSQKGEEWMGRFQQLFSIEDMKKNDVVNTKAVVDCYNALMECWANSLEDPNIYVARTERWLNKLMQLQKETSMDELGPNTQSFNIFLHALSRGRSGGGSRRSREDSRTAQAKRAQQLLQYMINQHQRDQQEHGDDDEKIRIVPNTESFNYVIRAWSRCRKTDVAPKIVMDILRQMEQYQRDDPVNSVVQPDNFSYCMAMDTWSNAAGRKALHPRADAHSGLYEAQQVELILKYMHDLYSVGHPEVVPNTVAYNTLLSTWSKLAGSVHHRNSTFQTEQVLRRMQKLYSEGLEEVKPDHISYTKVIQAWTNANRENSGTRAVFWLRKLWEEFEEDKDDRLCPRVLTYNAVMKASVAAGDPTQAENLLKELMQHDAEGSDLRPNTESFSHVIHAWLKSEQRGETNKAGDGCKRAAEWLDTLVNREDNGDLLVTTTPELYASLLKTASVSVTVGDADLLDLAVTIFDKFRASRHHVDHLSYTWVLQTGLVALAEPHYNAIRSEFVTQLYQDCCENGLISNSFLRALANGPVFHQGWTIEESARLTRKLLAEVKPGPEVCRNVKIQQFMPSLSDTKRTRFRVEPC